jgi:preprotein translocase subunit SecD
MIIRWNAFNHNFPACGPGLMGILGLAALLAAGCQSPESKKHEHLATLQLHLEGGMDATNRTETAVISQEPLIQFTVEKAPFLSEGDIKEAKVVDMVGGFSLRLEFDRRGGWLLEQYTLVNRGKHFAIYCQFIAPGEEKLNKGRWLAAPKIQQRISDGVLIFTPQATREEAESIALGLNNVSKKLNTGSEW